jgi:site-specific recombinase
MNAYEWSHKLYKTGWIVPLKETELMEVADMLRQQADTAKEQGIVNRALMERILELEKELAYTKAMQGVTFK